jgi:hypothetical protein
MAFVESALRPGEMTWKDYALLTDRMVAVSGVLKDP